MRIVGIIRLCVRMKKENPNKSLFHKQTHTERHFMISKYYVILLFFAALLFIGCKAFMSLIIYTSFSKNQYKKYKRETSFWGRYFIVSTQRYVKDRYSKSERRVIKHTSIVKILFYLNILLHLFFTIYFFSVLIFCFIIKNDAIVGSISLIYFLMILLFFFVFGLIEQYEKRNYHKKRSH